MRESGETARSRVLGPAVVLFASYFLLADLGHRWATDRGAASPVWPAAGVALAGLLLGGRQLWPAIFAARMAAFLVEANALPFWMEAAIATGNTLAAVGGAWALERVRLRLALTRLRDVLALIGVGLGSSAVGATMGSAVLAGTFGHGFERVSVIWLNWWAGNVMGVLVLSPLVLSWTRSEPIGRNTRQWIRLGTSTAMAGVVAWWIFGPRASSLPLAWAIFPALTWAALACGVRGAATAMVPTAIAAVWGTTAGFGPFASVVENLRLAVLQQFLGVAAMTSLVLAVVADERRRSELLRINEERLRLASRAGRTGVWTWNLTTGRSFWTEEACELYGHSMGCAVGYERWIESVHPDDRERARARVHEAVEQARCGRGGSHSYKDEYRVIHPNGTILWLESSGAIECKRDELVMLGVVRDITERKISEAAREQLLASERAARAEAERASRLKDEFLSTVSHELRTPLTAVLGWSQVLRRRANDADEDLRKGLTVIDRNARALAQLIEDLLDMSRITSGKVRLDVQSVDLHDVVDLVLSSVAPSVAAKHIRLGVHSSPFVGTVHGDPNRLRQVVWNLVSNAIKFTPSGGKVDVTLRRVDEQVEITVADTGQGIERAFLPHVFERFRQADGSTTREHGGLGLGLAIVKNLVELHGGTVEVTSDGEGKGATFAVKLPIVIEQVTGEAPEEVTERSGMAGRAANDSTRRAG